jgi:long-chain acyl-CoA synthetase
LAAPYVNLFDLLDAAANEDGGETAVTTVWGTPLTYDAWRRDAERLAGQLIAVGVACDDRVGIRLRRDSWLEFMRLFFAVVRAGAVPVPLPDTLPAAQVGLLMERLGIKLTVSEGPGLADGTVEYSDLLRSEPAAGLPGLGRDPHGTAVLIPTSGTSGKHRVVHIPHANLLSAFTEGVRRAEQRPVQLYAPVIGTQLGLFALMRPLGHMRPMCVVAPEGDHPGIAGAIEEYRVQEVTLVPHLAKRVAGSVHTHDVSSLTHVVVTGDNSSPFLLRRLVDAFPGAGIYNYYASTETYPAALFTQFDPARPRSLGAPVPPTEIRIGEPGQDTGPGETGPVWLRTAGVQGRTFSQAPEWKEEESRDGWIFTGDFGYLDDKGSLVLVDRDSDLVNFDGIRVGRFEVEAVLLEHPAIEDAAVYGKLAENDRTLLISAVKLNRNIEFSELRDYLSERLPGPSVPQRFILVDEIPRSQSGKVLKRALRERPMPAAPALSYGSAAEELRKIWQEILEPESEVSDDSDFLDLGGDSLSYEELVAAVQARIGVELKVNDCLQCESFRDMAELVRSAGRPAIAITQL